MVGQGFDTELLGPPDSQNNLCHGEISLSSLVRAVACYALLLERRWLQVSRRYLYRLYHCLSEQSVDSESYANTTTAYHLTDG